MSGSFHVHRAGCGGSTGGWGTSPTSCGAPPTWVGWVHFPYPRPGVLCLGFACDKHRDCLDVARPFVDEDRVELQRRRERDRLVIEEHQPVRKDPPVATGREALARLAAARKYGEEHAGDEGWWVREETSPGR